MQNFVPHIPNFIPTSFEAVYVWAKDWQVFLASLSVILAACILAMASVKAARIRAGSDPQPISDKAQKLHPDLRTAPGFGQGALPNQPVDCIGSLEHLRSLVRSGLSALTPCEGAADGAVGVTHLSYERIVSLPLEKFALPPDAPPAAHELKESLGQQIGTLSRLVGNKAPASDISDVLIKVNTTARNLARVLTQSSSAQTVPPPALKQH
jgi:hypothetical protein